MVARDRVASVLYEPETDVRSRRRITVLTAALRAGLTIATLAATLSVITA
jgi:hypothetical protein